MKKYFLFLLIVILIVPSVALASWWNPFTWKVFNFLQKKEVLTQIKVDEVKNDNIPPVSNEKIIISDDKEDKNESSKEIVSPIKSSNETIVKKDVQNVVDPRANLIAEFLKNPTLENLKWFCDSAKSVEGKTTKKIMDENKENLITVKKSLFEEMVVCQKGIYLDVEMPYIYYLPLGNNLLITLNDKDTDEIREMKLIYNDKIKILMSTSKLKFIAFRGKDEVSSPSEFFESLLDIIKKEEGQDDQMSIIKTQIAKGELENLYKKVVDLSRDFK